MLMAVKLLIVYQVLWTNSMQITSNYVNDLIVLFLSKDID